MEGRNYYASLFSDKAARNEKEKMDIAIGRAAAIGVVKALNKYKPGYLMKEDFEDAMSDAILNALLHIDDRTTGLSYADKCGLSSAIKTCTNVSRRNSVFSRIDRIDEDGEWYQDRRIAAEESDEMADFRYVQEDENTIGAMKRRILRECMALLSPEDKKIFRLRASNASSKEISDALGCSYGAAQKRVFDFKRRFDKMLHEKGYYAAA